MNKVALTLDSSHVLMRQVAVGLAEAGFDVALHARTLNAGLRETVRRIHGLGRRAVLTTADGGPAGGGRAVGDPDAAAGAEMDRVMETVRSEYGRLDVLVTRGAAPEREAATETDGSGPAGETNLPAARSREVRHAVETALRIPYHAICESLPLLSSSRGAVINVVDRDGGAEAGEGLIYLTRLMAGGMAPGVRVNAVTVGALDRLEGAGKARSTSTVAARGQDGWSRELTRTVLFILGQPYINGEVVRTGRPGARKG